MTGEIALARAVILTAFLDLGGKMSTAGSKSQCGNDAFKYFNDAKNWFIKMGDDFIFWCLLAEYEPCYVRHQAIKILNNGLPELRKAPGCGDRYNDKQRAYKRRHDLLRCKKMYLTTSLHEDI